MSQTCCSCDPPQWSALKALCGCFFSALLIFVVVGSAHPLERDQDRGKIQERLEILTMWKMMEALDLDKPTAEKIFGVRRQFLSQRKALLKQLGDDLDSLKRQLRESSGAPDEKELSRLLQNIRETRKKLQALQDEQYQAVSQVLTVRQQAELVLFLKEFQKELRGLFRPPLPPRPPTDREIGRRPPAAIPPESFSDPLGGGEPPLGR